MTDRVITLYVALEREMRVDDVEDIKKAIEMVKGVAGVTIHPRSAEDLIRMSRAHQELRVQLIDLIDNAFKTK